MPNCAQPLPHETFLQTFTLVPRVAICLLVRNAEGGILLARRSETMASMPGVWHLPGAFLLRGESFAACASRIAQKELGAGIVGETRAFGFFEDLDGDPRGHVVDLVIEADLTADPQATVETSEIRFFSEVPLGVAFHHDRVMRAAKLS